MSETASAPKKKAIEFVTVKIALVLCVIALVALLELDPFSTLLGLPCYIAAAVLFYTDHPKLVLLPAIIALLPAWIADASIHPIVIGGGGSQTSGYMTFWLMVQYLCILLLIIFAAITKKANPK